MTELLTSEEVRRRVPGLTYRQLYLWTQKGYLLPHGGTHAVMFNEGPGHIFRYPSTTVPAARVIVELTKAGFSPKSADLLLRAPDGVLTIGDTGYTVTLTRPGGGS